VSIGEMTRGLTVSRSRTIAWLTGCAVAFPVVGVACLVLASLASSATGIGLYEREIVAAAQTAMWGSLTFLTVIGIGKTVSGELNPIRPADVGVSLAGLAAATILAYLIFASTRSGGVLDVDAIGLPIWLPGLVIATIGTHLGVRSAPRGSERPWEVARLLVGATAVLVTIAALVS
jgi:hypothetical protein